MTLRQWIDMFQISLNEEQQKTIGFDMREEIVAQWAHPGNGALLVLVGDTLLEWGQEVVLHDTKKLAEGEFMRQWVVSHE